MIQEAIIPLITLISLEIILGIDNIIFISILADKLPPEQRAKLRYWGMGLAVAFRLILLYFISWIVKLDKNLFSILQFDFSGKDLILIAGGLFLIYKATKEIYHKTEVAKNMNQANTNPTVVSFGALLNQIILLDLVFSIDSIITAVGMVKELWVMYTAVIVSVLIMLMAAKPINETISRHPSLKVLALCFLLLIGVALMAEGIDFYIPKGYIYFSMAFAFIVDLIQIKTIKPDIKPKDNY